MKFTLTSLIAQWDPNVLNFWILSLFCQDGIALRRLLLQKIKMMQTLLMRFFFSHYLLQRSSEENKPSCAVGRTSTGQFCIILPGPAMRGSIIKCYSGTKLCEPRKFSSWNWNFPSSRIFHVQRQSTWATVLLFTGKDSYNCLHLHYAARNL